jgi:hypothetical protein
MTTRAGCAAMEAVKCDMLCKTRVLHVDARLMEQHRA